jgi:hypothetical protein
VDLRPDRLVAGHQPGVAAGLDLMAENMHLADEAVRRNTLS